MKTTQIENYINDVKENAKKTIATVVAVATIGSGAIALASCDNTQRVNANETTNEITTTDVVTNEGTGEVTTEATTTPAVREKTEEEKKLQDLLIEECPEFENGIYGFEIALVKDGNKIYACFIQALCCDENGGFIPHIDFDPIEFLSEDFNNIQETLGEKLTSTTNTNYMIKLKNLTDEEINYICSTYYNIYINSHDMNHEVVD